MKAPLSPAKKELLVRLEGLLVGEERMIAERAIAKMADERAIELTRQLEKGFDHLKTALRDFTTASTV